MPYIGLAVPLLVWLPAALWLVRFAWRINRATAAAPSKRRTRPPVSIVIAAKNEADNLERCLPAILEQDYPEFEVIVVNDQSWDASADVLKNLAQNPRLKVVNIGEQVYEFKGKKLALTLGIKAAKNDYLLFTDADCIPASPRWIAEMMKDFARPGKEIVIGYGAYEKTGSLVGLLTGMDTLYTATQYLGFALEGKPYMGVGRNMGYTRTLFFRAKGFAPFLAVPYGDDDLFVNKTATPENTVVCILPEAHTISIPKKTFGNWLRQKRRHYAAGRLYTRQAKRLTRTFILSQSSFYLALIAWFVLWPGWEGFVLLGAHTLHLWLCYWFIARRLRTGYLVPLLPIVYPLWHLLFLPLFGLYLLMKPYKKMKQW